MLTYCKRRQLYLLGRQRFTPSALVHQRRYESTTSLLDLQHYISPDRTGRRAAYGPLGTELKRNVLQQWWTSVVESKPQVFAISTLHCYTGGGVARVVDGGALDELGDQPEGQLKEKLSRLLQHSHAVRSGLLQGALQQYVPSLELMKRKLPFGLAETGFCYRPETVHSDAIGCGSSEVTEASLVWFCSPRTSSQWMDYWARQRLQWWRKFASGPSDFSMCDVLSEELREGASRGVKVLYRFPSGLETLETLWSLGDAELLKAHKGSKSKLQCRDGRKNIVPHVLSLSADIDRGVLAFLFNSLQNIQKVDSKQRLHQRKVLKLHPTLAPIKVALDMGRGSTSELRQVCEGLLQEFLEAGISAWPGYMDTTQSSLETLHAKYDEMGVMFMVVISDSTLENGLLLVRNRDTTIRETMHITQIRQFLLKYISAADSV
ncbi:DNA polymerase subunit gamma-2 [Salminus brasiliensis]|uniref:DNA polymerase subunit gamma-2 n=1 Tax=Salminus brasiliensis TaxID=930266 RepID=UPI003B835F34